MVSRIVNDDCDFVPFFPFTFPLLPASPCLSLAQIKTMRWTGEYSRFWNMHIQDNNGNELLVKREDPFEDLYNTKKERKKEGKKEGWSIELCREGGEERREGKGIWNMEEERKERRKVKGEEGERRGIHVS